MNPFAPVSNVRCWDLSRSLEIRTDKSASARSTEETGTAYLDTECQTSGTAFESNQLRLFGNLIRSSVTIATE
jgi:hypothetical protein